MTEDFIDSLSRIVFAIGLAVLCVLAAPDLLRMWRGRTR